MEFTTEKNGEYTIVAVSGRLDATTAEEFEEQAEAWLSSNATKVVIAMEGVEYISSAGLRAILSSAKKLRAQGGDILFCGLEGIVAEVFKMSGFASMFKIFATREQAIDS